MNDLGNSERVELYRKLILARTAENKIREEYSKDEMKTPVHLGIGGEAIAVAFFGDGAMEEGVFWESINFACLHKLRMLFVCEDNELAIHSSLTERRGFISPSSVLQDFRCHLRHGDGSDVGAVVNLTRDL